MSKPPNTERYRTGNACPFCASLKVVALGTRYRCDNCDTRWGMMRSTNLRNAKAA